MYHLGEKQCQCDNIMFNSKLTDNTLKETYLHASCRQVNNQDSNVSTVEQ